MVEDTLKGRGRSVTICYFFVGPGPSVYKTDALPLSYTRMFIWKMKNEGIQKTRYVTSEQTKKLINSRV